MIQESGQRAQGRMENGAGRLGNGRYGGRGYTGNARAEQQEYYGNPKNPAGSSL
jgi:hypothetical protein